MALEVGKPPAPFGEGDASFRAAGGEAGVARLVDDFYDLMEALPEARAIRALHPADLAVSRDKLATFLCGWLGGPRRYAERFGTISIPGAHQHLAIAEPERDAWLLCMERAIAQQGYAPDFAEYLLAQLRFPAQRIVEVCGASEPGARSP